MENKAPWDLTNNTQQITVVKIIDDQKKEYEEIIKDNKPILYSLNTDFGEVLLKNFSKDVVQRLGKYYNYDDDGEDTHDFIIKNKKFIAIGRTYSPDYDFILAFYSKLGEKELMKYLAEEINNDHVSLKPGVYSLEKDFMSGWSCKKMTLAKEDFVVLNENYDKKILKDINKFFKSKKFYDDNNLTFKRGILLYGSVGCGKSTVIRKILKVLSKSVYALVIGENTEISESMFRYIKDKFKDKPKVLIFEDIDGVEERQRSSLLNFIDGIKDNSNTFFIATTNHTEKLDSAISNRPSRFDTVKEIEIPNKESRSKLLLHYFPKLNKKDLEIAVRSTEGFSGAYFKEIFVFSMLRNMSLTDSIKQLQKQNKQFSEYKGDNTIYS